MKFIGHENSEGGSFLEKIRVPNSKTRSSSIRGGVAWVDVFSNITPYSQLSTAFEPKASTYCCSSANEIKHSETFCQLLFIGHGFHLPRFYCRRSKISKQFPLRNYGHITSDIRQQIVTAGSARFAKDKELFADILRKPVPW